MNLFTARLTGKMLSTDAFEKEMAAMLEHVRRWRQIEKSPELAEYLTLKKEVESAEFQKRKNDLESIRYEETQEGQKMKMMNRLSSTLRMKGYKYALENETFQAFLKFVDSGAMQEREENSISASERRMYNMIARSAFYKNYQKVANSQELKQLVELEKETSTEEFQQRNAFWADSKRWEHSEEYKTYSRYQELAKSADIRFYFESREEKIDWAELFRPSFSDDMSSGVNWQAGYGYANPAMRDGHSRTNERQAYTGGKNTLFAEGRMDIETRAGQAKAIAWDEKRGFVEADFEYTSDVMNTKSAFMQENGLFMAKVRSQGTGHHFFGLSTGKVSQPLVALYHYNGDVHQLGLIDGQKSHLATLTGVLRSMYHVYSFRWSKKELVWYVNDMEVLRVPNTLPKEAMFLLAQSFLPKSEKGGEGKLKIQWARVYRPVE